MIGTILRIGWINMRRDRVVQALTFLLPIMFFSIFATVFGSQNNGTPRVRVAIVDEDHSDFSQTLVKALQAEGGLRARTTTTGDAMGDVLTRQSAESLVRDATVPVAIVLPKGLGEGHAMAGGFARGPKVQILADVSDPIASQVVIGMLQKVSFMSAAASRIAAGLAPMPADGLATEIVNVMQPGKSGGSMISFYAAGVGVMFLLFSASSAGGALLDEEESGTLGRLLGSEHGMGGILAGKWLYVATLGCVQLTVMFLWGALMFQLPLASHIPGFAVMTVFTASAVAGFGLLLATLSRSRAQLSGISTILILGMSAIGGSMFPRFLMSETMQKAGLITFNAWALDGYLKVFWRGVPLIDLWPQALVLTAATVVFMSLARLFARRWETL